MLSLRIVTTLLIAIVSVAHSTADQPLTGDYLGQTPPGSTSQVFAPGIVSTCWEHSAAMFTPDGEEVWFARLEPGAIYYMELGKDSWMPPVVAPFSGRYHDLYPCLSYDGNRIVYSSNRPVAPGENALTRGVVHLWMVTRNEVGWGAPQYLGTEINAGRRQACGTVAPDGSIYLGASAVAGSPSNLFVSRIVDGLYAAPVSLGDKINSPRPDSSPYLSPDGSFLVFSSFRGGYGRSDLFVSFVADDGSWTTPLNLGDAINSPAKDEYPYLSPDGKYLFFNSNRVSVLNDDEIPDGPGNIYWVDAGIIERLRPAASE